VASGEVVLDGATAQVDFAAWCEQNGFHEAAAALRAGAEPKPDAEVVTYPTDEWGEPDHWAPPVRLERNSRGNVVMTRGLPEWFPSLAQISRPAGTPRESKPQATAKSTKRGAARSTARGSRSPPEDPSPPPLRVVSLARFRRDVAAWLEAVGR
jgi:hypothetical protein